MPRAIRILADRSKDANTGRGFTNLLPPAEFQCTDNRERLRRALLGKYDVLAMCGESLKKHTRAELAAIGAFVEGGGGLVLAADASVFELEANQPAKKMAQNAVAGVFGAEFLSADCEGAKVDASLRVGLRQKEVKVRKHPALGDASAGLIAGGCGPISPPEGAWILASHRGTGAPVAAAFPFGEGRVVMVGATGFATDRVFTCQALARWLAGGKAGAEGDGDLPAYIGKRGGIKRGEYFHVAYDQACAGLVDETMELLEKVRSVLKARFGEKCEPERTCSLTDAVTGGNPWEFEVGGQALEASRARCAVSQLLARGAERREFHDCMDAVFSTPAWHLHLALGVLHEIGFEAEVVRCRERMDRRIAEMDERASTFDLARNYTGTQESCPRGLVVLRDLEKDHGGDVMRKLAAAIPEKDPFKHLPSNYAWPSDRGIYYLSLAVGKDLFPWFSEHGLTVHRLPIVKPDAKNVKARMIKRLGEAMRDDAEALSSRMDAATDLVSMGKEKDWGKDDWGRLCAGMKRSKEVDARAAGQLQRLFAEGKPAAVRAIAGVALADLGDASVADELVPLARQFEPRFQLLAGHALSKAGSGRADELSLQNITDAEGNKVGDVEVKFDGYIAMHAKVEGYRVANNFSQPEMCPFTAYAATSHHEVHWVHTSEVWRRRGLARHLFEKAMNYPAAVRCSTSVLGTGTRNVAHPLYQSYGFTDVFVSEGWVCELPGNAPLPPPMGVILREYAEGDGPKVAALYREVRGDTLHMDWWPPRGAELAPNEIAFLAEQKGELIGVACAEYGGGDEARMRYLAIKEGDERDRIADGLLRLVHRVVWDLGAKRIKWWEPHEADHVREALNRSGYVARKTGGVWMLQVRHLPQLLAEIAPAIEKRLAESDFKRWTGRIDLLGHRLRGRVTVSKGKVKAGRPGAEPAHVILTCDDDTATRVALGRETPFEAYLQTRLAIEPRVTASITKLLEVVFPKVKW